MLAFAAAVSFIRSVDAYPQAYPERPLRIITSAAAGSGIDVLNRIVAAKLGEFLGQQVVVDNRPGAGATIAPSIAAQATPDGYTLLHCAIADAIAPSLYKKLSYEMLRDFSPISLLGTTPNILVIHPSLPAHSVREFIAYARSNPGKVAYASTGVGNSTHLTMELFKSRTGIDLLHVPYKGGPILITDLYAGRVSAMMSFLPAQIESVRSGKLRALAVSTPKRNSRLPEVPTILESGVADFDVTVWFGLCASAKVPGTVRARIHAEVVKAVGSPDLRIRFEQSGVDPQSSGSEHFAAFFRAEQMRWAQVVTAARIPAQQ